MKGKIVVLVIFIVFLSCCIQVDGLKTSIDNKKCNCENALTEGYTGLTEKEIADLQNQIDQNGGSFTVGINSVTDKSIDELCGLVIPDSWEEGVEFDPCDLPLGTPSSFDWRNPQGHKGANWDCTTPIKDQDNCGSCWAFGTVGPLESAILIEDRIKEDLSEQWLVSCNTNGYSCNGGWWAHQWHAGTNGKCGGTGAVLEADYPYTASNGVCGKEYPHKYLIERWAYVGGQHSVPSTSSLKNAIYDYGPISASVYVDSGFQAYTGGIFDGTASGRVNHAVVLVGWNDNGGYWILRNSWGTGWGESGYMRIKYGSQKIGYAACYVDGYNTQFSGDQNLTLQFVEITNDPDIDDFDQIDLDIPFTDNVKPEWYYKLEMGPDFKAQIENLKPGQGGESNFWPFDNFKSEHTWDLDSYTKGHIIGTETRLVDIKFEFWDSDWPDILDDQADITPRSGRSFNGNYDLVEDQLYFSDDTKVSKSQGIFVMQGNANTDDARVKLTITDSYDKSDYIPNLGVNPSSIDFGKKGQGSYTETLTILNTARVDPFDWADNLDWTASDDKSWITLSKTSGSLSGKGTYPITVTIDANDLSKGKTHSGTITIESNGGTKTVDVSIRVTTKAKEKPLLLMQGFLQKKLPSMLILLGKILKSY